MTVPAEHPHDEWWRRAVIYQVYPRSFADSTGDGVGDLRGIRARLPQLAELGIDAVWLSPIFLSPQKDAGYDVADYRAIDPLFGTLDDADALVAEAHRLGLRVIFDLVPNHTSDQHEWFRAALAAGHGSPERERYIFRDGRGERGELPPNNWQSIFGGAAWSEVPGEPGRWYLHLFDSSQPDLNWHDPGVRSDFLDVLRFWLDRGVDGFRVDVAHGMIKADGLPDYTPREGTGSMGGTDGTGEIERPPYWGQDGVHEIYREWRAMLDAEYSGRVLCGEAWVEPISRLADWVRPDEMHQTFNFAYLETAWDAAAVRRVIDESIAAFSAVGAPSTWVLSNHDVVRHATRLSLTGDNPQGDGIARSTPGLPDEDQGIARARAATALMLALPGSAYIYQGEELGLPEALDLPDDSRADPTWFRTKGEKFGRDGCRVPIPWEADAPSFGFGPTDASWLPQPESWRRFARDAQAGDPASTLEMYRAALRIRRERRLHDGDIEWIDAPSGCLAFRSAGTTVVTNFGDAAVPVPAGDVLLASGSIDGGLAPDTTVWLG
ncbi:glycoside hydrolase family 13 protein [Microbacterium halophytorum]|uniref:glycoside hydrolase family 13 protein n=1 Tax=Microbacterium halophytorum TaxID=2067568 RepID=UPI000CFC8995|nr:alpha-amylase family glycosyl hydrolase [Microbacterium halophytorum]